MLRVIVSFLLVLFAIGAPVKAQDLPTDPDHAKIVDALVDALGTKIG